MPTSAAVDVRDVRKSYGDVRALDGVTWQAPRGAVTAVLGRNGAGKTTSVGVCTGRLRADDGAVTVLGTDPRGAGSSWRARVGVMPQSAGSGVAGVYPAARVGETLRLFASFATTPLDVHALLDRLDLTRLAGTPWRRLSGGEQQRLSLALAIVGRPELVFLDEPTAGLDVHARHEVWSLLEQMREAGMTIVLTTHTMEEAERLADHVVVIDAGRTVATGSVADLTPGASTGLSFDARPALPIGDLQRTLPAASTVTEPRPGHYVIEGAVDAAVVAQVTAWCASQGALPERLDTQRQRLEDVFLDLTRGTTP